jgi:16S rRNA (cytidine1402-2'-O)-methyltransferase
MGTLYLVSTPIGNLEDLSPRAARVRGEVDGILAEDTRHTATLLRHLGVQTPLLSYHRHNERARLDGVLARLDEGASLALVSDAGTPIVSDPGESLVAAVRGAGHEVVPIPGPSAVLAALVASGLPAIPFTFLGFIPRKGRDRTEFIERVRGAPETLVCFESPERTLALLEDLEAAGLGDREITVARELTKRFEEIRSGTVSALAAAVREVPPRGEVTVVIGPAPTEETDRQAVDEGAARALGKALLEEGRSPSRAAREVAQRLSIPKNEAYRIIQGLTEA